MSLEDYGPLSECSAPTPEQKRDLLAEVIAEMEKHGAKIQWHVDGWPIISSWLVKLREVKAEVSARLARAEHEKPEHSSDESKVSAEYPNKAVTGACEPSDEKHPSTRSVAPSATSGAPAKA